MHLMPMQEIKLLWLHVVMKSFKAEKQVTADCVQLKDLEARLKNMQWQIEKHGASHLKKIVDHNE